jgi:hypothetical protein
MDSRMSEAFSGGAVSINDSCSFGSTSWRVSAAVSVSRARNTDERLARSSSSMMSAMSDGWSSWSRRKVTFNLRFRLGSLARG